MTTYCTIIDSVLVVGSRQETIDTTVHYTHTTDSDVCPTSTRVLLFMRNGYEQMKTVIQKILIKYN